MIIEAPIIEVSLKYYSAVSQIDRHSCCSSDDRKFENEFEVYEWSARANNSYSNLHCGLVATVEG